MQILGELGFTVLDSTANFVFAKSPAIGGKELYTQLKANGILVRHFDTPRLRDYVRVTIGSQAQMAAFIETTTSILEGTT